MLRVGQGSRKTSEYTPFKSEKVSRNCQRDNGRLPQAEGSRSRDRVWPEKLARLSQGREDPWLGRWEGGFQEGQWQEPEAERSAGAVSLGEGECWRSFNWEEMTRFAFKFTKLLYGLRKVILTGTLFYPSVSPFFFPNFYIKGKR